MQLRRLLCGINWHKTTFRLISIAPLAVIECECCGAWRYITAGDGLIEFINKAPAPRAHT